MKRILALITSIFIAGTVHADCASSLGINFTPNQTTALCSVFGSAIQGSLIPGADNTYDVGSSTLGWRTGYFDTSVITPLVSHATSLALGIAGTAEVTVTNDTLTFSGAADTVAFGATSGTFSVGGTSEAVLSATTLTPGAVAGNALGTVALPWSQALTGTVAIDADVTDVTGTDVAITSAKNNSSSADNMALVGYGANTVGANLRLMKTRAVTTDANTAVTTGDDLGAITAHGASGTIYKAAGALAFDSEGTITTTAVPGVVKILTADAVGDNLVRWSVNSSGVLANDGTSGGNINLTKSGTSLAIQEATAGTKCMGTATANGTTAVTVATTCVLTASRIFISRTSAVNAGVTEPGCWATNIVNATSFDLDCNDAAEDSTFNWIIFQEAA